MRGVAREDWQENQLVPVPRVWRQLHSVTKMPCGTGAGDALVSQEAGGADDVQVRSRSEAPHHADAGWLQGCLVQDGGARVRVQEGESETEPAADVARSEGDQL